MNDRERLKRQYEAAAVGSRRWRWRESWWLLLSLVGLGGAGLIFAGSRVKKSAWIIFGAVLLWFQAVALVIAVFQLLPDGPVQGVASGISFRLVCGVALAAGIRLNREYLMRREILLTYDFRRHRGSRAGTLGMIALGCVAAALSIQLFIALNLSANAYYYALRQPHPERAHPALEVLMRYEEPDEMNAVYHNNINEERGSGGRDPVEPFVYGKNWLQKGDEWQLGPDDEYDWDEERLTLRYFPAEGEGCAEIAFDKYYRMKPAVYDGMKPSRALEKAMRQLVQKMEAKMDASVPDRSGIDLQWLYNRRHQNKVPPAWREGGRR
jgi:hypothetical protein